MDLKFHCGSEGIFLDSKPQVKAFLKTDYSVEHHSHDFYEMNIIFEGTGIHRVAETCVDVKKGNVFMIPPMVAHSYHDTENLSVYHILLHKDFIDSNMKDSISVPGFLQLMEIEPFLRRHSSKKMFLQLSHKQIELLKPDLDIIEEYGFYDTDDFEQLKSHTTWKILYWLSSLLHSYMYESNNKSLNKRDVEITKVLEYIHQNYSSKITVDVLCRKIFTSRSTFIRRFRNMCGCTPMRYVNEYRCNKALKMLEVTNLSKTEIAHCCGFYDLSHMERILHTIHSPEDDCPEDA